MLHFIVYNVFVHAEKFAGFSISYRISSSCLRLVLTPQERRPTGICPGAPSVQHVHL